MHHEDSFVVRIGLFFFVLGGAAFILFVTSDLANKADFDYLFIAMVLIGIGWPMWRRRPPAPPSGRFEYIRKLRGNGGQKKIQGAKEKEGAPEEKEAAPKDKW